MKKVLFLCLLLCGCYSPLYINDPYVPTNPDDVVLKLREDMGSFDKDLDYNFACPNAKQIALIKDSSFWPLFFVDNQSVLYKVREQAASLGGDTVSVYDMSHMWFLLFGFTSTRSIVYKCNPVNRNGGQMEIRGQRGYGYSY